MIKLTLKGFAKFMVGHAAQQRKILYDYKYPEVEGYAQASYYRDAREIIEGYHSGDYQVDWLYEKAIHLQTQAEMIGGAPKKRYLHNARAILCYAKYFTKTKLKTLPKKHLTLDVEGVKISVTPDLYVKNGNGEKLIKLELVKDPPTKKIISIISQILFEAQSQTGMGLRSSSVLYYDVLRGKIYKGARMGSRIRREIEAACKNIAAMWDGI